MQPQWIKILTMVPLLRIHVIRSRHLYRGKIARQLLIQFTIVLGLVVVTYSIGSIKWQATRLNAFAMDSALRYMSGNRV